MIVPGGGRGSPSPRAEERALGEVLKSRDLCISHTRVRRSFDCAARMTRLLAQDDSRFAPAGLSVIPSGRTSPWRSSEVEGPPDKPHTSAEVLRLRGSYDSPAR